MKGFSLIELLMVLMMVSVLSLVAYPSYQRFMWRSERARVTVELQHAALLASMYYASHHSYANMTLRDVAMAANQSATLTRLSNHTFTLSIKVASAVCSPMWVTEQNEVHSPVGCNKS